MIQAKIAEQRYGGLFAPVLAWTVLIVGHFGGRGHLEWAGTAWH